MSQPIILPYDYAAASFGTRNYVYFRALNPATGRLERVRYYLDRTKDAKTLKRKAAKMVEAINAKLESGWNPFTVGDSTRQFTPLDECLDFILKIKLPGLRDNTVRVYTRRIELLRTYLKAKKLHRMYVGDFTATAATDFMNYLVTDKKLVGRNYNNHLLDYKTLFNVLVSNKYIAANPFADNKKKTEKSKRRQAFTDEQLSTYVAHVKANHYGYYIASMFTYCAAVRPAEFICLKVGDIDFKRGVLRISADIAKNKVDSYVILPNYFLAQLQAFVGNAPANYYILGTRFMPGVKKNHYDSIRKTFGKIRKLIGLPAYIDFYSLKDTAADKMIEQGFDIKHIKNHLRHSSLAATDKYIQSRPAKADRKLREYFPAFE